MALLFYPYAFSGVCTGEMSGIRDRLDEFLTFDTEVLAISCDPVYSLRAFADAEGLNFPLLVRLLAARRGVARPSRSSTRSRERLAGRRTSSTATGMLRWAVHNANPDGRDLDEHLGQLHAALS